MLQSALTFLSNRALACWIFMRQFGGIHSAAQGRRSHFRVQRERRALFGSLALVTDPIVWIFAIAEHDLAGARRYLP